MAEVWKRPGLVGVEIAWRWVAWLAVGVPVVALGGVWLGSLGMDIQFHAAGLSSLTVFKPVQAIASLREFASAVAAMGGKPLVWMGLAMICVWVVAWTVGRAMVLRRLEPGLASRVPALAVLCVLRMMSLITVLAIWLGVCRWAVDAMVVGPAERQGDPNLVLAFAAVVSSALVLFVLWCVVSWVLQLAPLVAMGRNEGVVASLRGAWRSGALRGKLIEINLVMGIVKVALVVLAMVFSACPLPFSSVETQEFLNWWWAGVAVFYLVASDYFHVVRVAAYLRLAQAYEIVPERISSGTEAAS